MKIYDTILHTFHLKVDFTNGGTAILTTPELRRCDLDNWLFYMGVHRYCICAVDDRYCKVGIVGTTGTPITRDCQSQITRRSN